MQIDQAEQTEKELVKNQSVEIVLSEDQIRGYLVVEPEHAPKDPYLSEEIVSMKKKVESGRVGLFIIRFEGKVVSVGRADIFTYNIIDWLPHNAKFAQLDDAFTQERYRGLGLHKKIVEARVRWAEEKGLKWAETTVSEHNIPSILGKLRSGFFLISPEEYRLIRFLDEGLIKKFQVNKDEEQMVSIEDYEQRGKLHAEGWVGTDMMYKGTKEGEEQNQDIANWQIIMNPLLK